MKYIFSFTEITDEKIKYAGGKGASLVKMTKAGLPVPMGYVILYEAFEAGELKEAAKAELDILINEIADNSTYAIRSSALNEDGENASFAGAYETLIDVSRSMIESAVNSVSDSVNNIRVQKYADCMNRQESDIAVVIQKFIKAEFAGVLFTSDVISGSEAKMQGNYVKGNGESLVSGSTNAEEFSFNALKYSYNGSSEFEKYAKNLYRCAVKIRKLYGCPMDIEWAVSDGKVYILQARPITTLNGRNIEKYQINGSLSGEYLLSKTNVGEIFMTTVSPATFGILESICDMLGLPHFIDNVCGQAYCNISVVCSMLVSLGFTKKKAYSFISDIAGKIPADMEIPVFPFEKGTFLKKMSALIFSRPKKKTLKMGNSEFIDKMADIADEMISQIRVIDNNKSLLDYWYSHCDEFMGRVMGAIASSLQIKSLLNTRDKLEKAVGSELANELISGCTGNLESMKPLLLLEDVITGKADKNDYITQCGHRSAYEMELSKPYPYENPDFPDNIIEEHRKSGIDVHKMKEECEKQFCKAREKFISIYPHKTKWLDKCLADFSEANQSREKVRSKAVKLFCVMREYILKAAELNNLDDDVFMLYFTETMQLLDGDKSVLKSIAERKKNYQTYCSYLPFPNVICGRFEPDKWIADENRRLDFYSSGHKQNISDSDIKGYAGAAGTITGKARVITDLNDADTLEKGEILVTTATNIGWTIIFPKAAAIITDIGAPLSHAAIVAREFGIPAVVGCGNATTMLKTGDTVRVDGAAGTVEII